MPTATNESYFFSTGWYYGDSDFITRTFDFIAYSNAAMRLAAPDTNAHMTCSTDTDSHVTCNKQYDFL